MPRRCKSLAPGTKVCRWSSAPRQWCSREPGRRQAEEEPIGSKNPATHFEGVAFLESTRAKRLVYTMYDSHI